MRAEAMNTNQFTRLLQSVACASALLLLSLSAAAAGYSTRNGRIYDIGGNELQIRGISHYGFNATILQPEYLWQMGWKEQIAQIKSLGFNAVRLPFVPDTLYETAPVNQLSYVDPGRNADLIGKTPLQVMDMWMTEADRVGLYVMLDFHSVSKQRQYPTWFVSNPADFGLMYNNQAYTAADWTRDLALVARRYAHLSHFFGIDVYNEPNGVVRWSSGDVNMTDKNNYWKDAVESASSAVLAANPNLLIFVQGIAGNFDGIENTNLPMNWGEDFQPQAYQPLLVPADKLVLSPHTYGPDVYPKSTFSAPNFPANLSANWDQLFGQFAQVHPVVAGEWGGRFGQGGTGAQDVAWQNAFVDYLLSKGISSSFYWCYTPNSGDTGGILDDNLNVRDDKMALLRRLWGSAPAAVAPAAPATPVTTPAPATTAAPATVPASGPVVTVAPASTASTPSPDVVITGTNGTTGGGGAFDMLWILALCATVLLRPRQLWRGATVSMATGQFAGQRFLCTVTNGAAAARSVTVVKHAHVHAYTRPRRPAAAIGDRRCGSEANGGGRL
jgi:aryl-phospho-beta-D-glucosidase BglC (GH1 family)